ncbi:MAG: tetratricopeptide repeat protein, partial [Treponema sp.]|nr:tetratricopeptide repeat protein [Treponema sp.]
MKFSLKRFILGGIIAASITGIIISCETVDPATMKTVSSIDYSPIRLIDANKGAPGQTVVINVPNTNVNGNQGEVDVTNVDNGEENNNPAAGEQNGGTEDNQTGTNPEGVGSENENTGTDNTDSTTTEPSGNKTESGNAGDNENVSGDKTGKSDSPVSGPSKNTASGGSNNTGSTQTAAESARERVLRQARENIDNGKYSQAITALNTWLKSNPDDGDAKNLLEEAKEKQAQANAEAAEKARQDKLKQARDYIDAGKYSNAITVLNGLLKTDPNDAEAKKLLEEAQSKQAQANADAAAKARADKLKQAKDYIDAGKYSNAITVLNGLLKTDPNDAEAKALLDEAKEKQEKANAEAAAKARADKLKQAKDYIDAGKYSNAITVLNGLLKTDPNDAEAKKLLEEAQSKQAQANADA